jgi:hypothetical protein
MRQSPDRSGYYAALVAQFKMLAREPTGRCGAVVQCCFRLVESRKTALIHNHFCGERYFSKYGEGNLEKRFDPQPFLWRKVFSKYGSINLEKLP